MSPTVDPTPDPEVLAAIAAAYRLLTAATQPPPLPEPPRWRLAARLPIADGAEARTAARATSRWKVAGRLDG